MGNIIEHKGVVTAVGDDMMTVQITSISACASCAAHAKCGFAESKEKTLEIPRSATKHTKSSTFHVGDKIVVCIDESSGLKAVWTAYIVPALLIIGVVSGLSAANAPEGMVALAAFGVLGLYILALILLRKRIDKHFEITIRTC